ncbi:MAG: hypothetical protein NVSMB22_25290 [Chloroflexota bacterium]
MTGEQPAIDELARVFAGTISAAWIDQARYFLALPDDAWNDPTGCARWTMHDLAGHVVGEAVWFSNLVRTVTDGARPLPGDVWDTLKALPGTVDAYAMIGAADLVVQAIDGATAGHLEQAVDLGFTRMPLWRALHVGLMESIFHNWDGRARRESNATIPTAWALHLATSMPEFVPFLVHRDAVPAAQGRYLLQVGDGVGPITISVEGDDITVDRENMGTPDVTLQLTADQYVRLMAGRLPLERAAGGDAGRAMELNRLFAGIAN